MALSDVMQEVASTISGTYLRNSGNNHDIILANPYVIHYRHPSKYVVSTFTILTHVDVDEDVYIIIKNFNHFGIAKRFYKNEQFYMSASGDKEKGQKLIEGLVMDPEFLNPFQELYDQDVIIEIRNQTIMVYCTGTVDGLFSDITAEKLINMYHLCKELKTGIDYYNKRHPHI